MNHHRYTVPLIIKPGSSLLLPKSQTLLSQLMNKPFWPVLVTSCRLSSESLLVPAGLTTPGVLTFVPSAVSPWSLAK